MPDYSAAFPVGTTVRVVSPSRLREFRERWKFHHPLEDSQLPFAARLAVVQGVAYYHGGDPLYELRGCPGLWHESCLEAL